MKKNSLFALCAACLMGLPSVSFGMSELVAMSMELQPPTSTTPANVVVYKITTVMREGQGLLNVTLTSGGMPEGAIVTFDPNTLRYTGKVPDVRTSTMTVTCPYPMPIYNIPFTVTGTARRESITITNLVTGSVVYQAPVLSLQRSHLTELRGMGTSGQTYQIQSCTDLSNPAWTVLGSTTSDSAGRFSFPIGEATLPARFFRAMEIAPAPLP